MENGWIKFHRKMFDNKLWLSEPFTKAQAWIDIFGNTNHKPGSFWVRGNEVKVGRGQLGWSEITMAKRWGWSREKVRRFLKYLEGEGNIRQQKDNKTTIITVIKYDIYQSNETTEKQQTRQQTRHKQELYKNEENTSGVPPQEVVKVIDAFKPVNPSYQKWFANVTQRGAIDRLIKIHGLDRLLNVIAFLVKSNTIPYIPTITSPFQLEEKWADLEAGLTKLKNKSAINKPNVIFS